MVEMSALSDMRVLLEDDMLLNLSTAEMLEDMGCSVGPILTAEEALVSTQARPRDVACSQADRAWLLPARSA